MDHPRTHAVDPSRTPAMDHPRLPATMRFIQRDWLSCNQIVFYDGVGADRHATLVDTGYCKHAEHTLALVTHTLARDGLPISGLRHILNTHLHSDHCGGNATLARASGARIRVPIVDLETVRNWDQSRLTYQSTGQYCERFAAEGAIAPGDELLLGGLEWRVLAAPGHDPHSMILHCATERLLICADALWENGFGIIFPELAGQSGFQEQHDVLELIASLPVDLAMPGHGRVFGDVPGAIARARSRLQALRADPRRNARNAIKALVKFLLLERERLSMAGLIEQTANASVMQNAAAQIDMALPDALHWACRELVAQGQLGLAEDGSLVNAEPDSRH